MQCCSVMWQHTVLELKGAKALRDRLYAICLKSVRTHRSDISEQMEMREGQLNNGTCAPQSAETEEELRGMQGGFHAVLSDMCHNTVGSVVADVARSLALATAAAKIALGPFFQQLPLTGRRHMHPRYSDS
jgi:23S rRNA U2552 (ribose-2'-O)-methylase RlmE/FtsJ